MRRKPERGQKCRLLDNTEVTILETEGKDFVRVILPNGLLTSVHKKELELPIINTMYYEKLSDSKA